METEKFDQGAYWKKRHRDFRNDPRSVGNAAASIEHNYEGERDLQGAVSELAGFLRQRKYSSVLDLGCGYGRVAGSLISKGFSYTGIDISDEAIKTAKKNHPKGVFLQGDLRELNIAKKFDVVLILYVLVHFTEDEDWRKFLAAACQRVKRDGCLLFADYFPPERISPVPHVVSRPLAQYNEELAKLGFTADSRLQQQISLIPYDSAKVFKAARAL
ncbi:class I SAM-dependent methyltransferase [Methylocella sp. CPCC 101449]|uniref:class I SAM-dependent methyltransferase n=1 Tax=Methylocella sp. CPCC 101449 TaxID=2987531 RepID=UPI00288C648B|nr:class I SAM-dependent methyltransferase [Methylocella sp. CPCC 101449]MDT2019451.1 class I SAM-dependent methyltransferase [Methylocella sp. CPCC 101449]